MSDAERIERLFEAAVDLDPAAAQRMLDETCVDAPNVRAKVERLLAHDRAASSGFLEPRGHPGELRESARVGHYLVLRKLGAGGMGDVYIAYDESLDRRVALKVLRPSVGPAISLRQEAKALARLSHPHVVQVYEIGEHQGRPWIAMELVEGVTLREWLAADKRTAEEILRLFLQCGRGLIAAHEASLVHRDFKPANVIVGVDGRARVLDFGLAAPRSDETDGLIAGTPEYMSPEQLGGEPVTSASDQFSFSVALYRALFEKPPFAGDDLVALRKNVLAGALRRPPPAPVPDWVTPILLRGLARHAAARYDALADLLAAIESKLPHDPHLDPSVTRHARSSFTLVMLGVAACILTGIFLSGGFDALGTRNLVIISACVFAMACTGMAVLRRRLLANRFGTRFAAVIAVGTGSLLVHRVFALHFDQPLPQVVTIDMVMLSFELVLAAILVQRWFAWGAAFLFTAAVLSAFIPAWSLFGFVVAIVGTFAVGVGSTRRN